MSACSSFDQLPCNPYPLPRFANASFEHIANAKLAPNLLDVDRLTLVGECGIGRYHEAAGNTRQIGCQIFSNAGHEVLLFGIVAEIVEGKDDDRQPRCQAIFSGRKPMPTDGGPDGGDQA